LSSAAVRPVKCTSPPKASLSSTGAVGDTDTDTVGGAKPGLDAVTADPRGAAGPPPQPASSTVAATTARRAFTAPSVRPASGNATAR
jgi:hypothetical protein